LALLAVITVIDAAAAHGSVLEPLLVLGPLLSALHARPAAVAVVAAVAVALCLALGLADDALDATDQILAALAVTAGGALAVVLSRMLELQRGNSHRQRAELAGERRARQRSELLARSGELLGSAQESNAILREISALPVPDLADLAIIDLLQDDGTLRGAVTSAVDPEIAATLTELRERFPLDRDGPHPVSVALRTGLPQLRSEMTDEELQRYAQGPEHLDLVRRSGWRSALVLPLTARGRTAGALSLLRLRGRGHEPFDDEDVELGLDLARRAALALDNARLFGELAATRQRLEAIVANLGEAVMAYAPDGTPIFGNPAAAELAGCATVEELLRTDLVARLDRWVMLDEHGGLVEADQLPMAAALRGDDPEPFVLRIVHRETGEDRWLITRAQPVRGPEGDLRFIVAVTEDVGTVKRQERRERMLSNASKLLGSSLDVTTTLQKAAWAVVPELADWARVDLPDDRGLPGQVATAHRDLEKLELLELLEERHPDDPRVAEVLRTGKSQLITAVPADELHQRLATRTMLVVPLRIGDRTIGTLQLATTADSERRLGAEQLALAEELARRAAIAVENARVHEARTHIASTLQRSLLPPRLPLIPGLAIAARFRAAGDGATEVGGDFYDLFEARDRWLVMMGDVTGKGPGAAAITSLARYTMRTVAEYEDDPATMLARLNATLGGEGDRRQICTAVCVTVRPAPSGADLEIVCAGHPAPLLVDPDGDVRPVGRPGTLLGAFAEGRWTTTRLHLAPGASLVLYTDGVTDTRGPEGRFGTDRLEALLREIGPAEPDATAQRIEAALEDFGEQRDDVALLVLRATGSASQPQAALAGEVAGRAA